MFTKAIVKKPCENMVNGISTANLGKPDYKIAVQQHAFYVETLKSCGLEVIVLDADNEFPDSTFVEDTALLTPKCAIIMNPAVNSRKGEVKEMIPVIKAYYKNVEYVLEPGTAEAGDIMMVGEHFYIGISERTNLAGANQIIKILEKYRFTGSIVSFEKILHLKTGISYLENNNLLISGEFLTKAEFKDFNHIVVSSDEIYASNCIWVNDKVLIAQGFPKIKKSIEIAGYKTIECNMSEFQKLDGGLSCLSLRF